MIDFNRDFAEHAEKEKGRCRLGSRLDEWARWKDAYLNQRHLSSGERYEQDHARGVLAAQLSRSLRRLWLP